MLGSLEAPPREDTRAARLARLLARRRAFIFVPLFLLAIGLAIRAVAPPPREVIAAAGAVVLGCWSLRVWATGYRSWMHNDGAARYLMSAGPYARIRHPLYLANGVSGAAALVGLGQYELLAVYSVAYVLVTALIVRREEEALERRFGADHAAYRASVPGFLPIPGRSMPAAARRGEFSWDPVRRGFEVWKLAVITGIVTWWLLR